MSLLRYLKCTSIQHGWQLGAPTSTMCRSSTLPEGIPHQTTAAPESKAPSPKADLPDGSQNSSANLPPRPRKGEGSTSAVVSTLYFFWLCPQAFMLNTMLNLHRCYIACMTGHSWFRRHSEISILKRHEYCPPKTWRLCISGCTCLE